MFVFEGFEEESTSLAPPSVFLTSLSGEETSYSLAARPASFADAPAPLLRAQHRSRTHSFSAGFLDDEIRPVWVVKDKSKSLRIKRNEGHLGVFPSSSRSSSPSSLSSSSSSPSSDSPPGPPAPAPLFSDLSRHSTPKTPPTIRLAGGDVLFEPRAPEAQRPRRRVPLISQHRRVLSRDDLPLDDADFSGRIFLSENSEFAGLEAERGRGGLSPALAARRAPPFAGGDARGGALAGASVRAASEQMSRLYTSHLEEDNPMLYARAFFEREWVEDPCAFWARKQVGVIWGAPGDATDTQQLLLKKPLVARSKSDRGLKHRAKKNGKKKQLARRGAPSARRVVGDTTLALPDEIFICHIFPRLFASPRGLSLCFTSVSLVCARWRRLALDAQLWTLLFRAQWAIVPRVLPEDLNPMVLYIKQARFNKLRIFRTRDATAPPFAVSAADSMLCVCSNLCLSSGTFYFEVTVTRAPQVVHVGCVNYLFRPNVGVNYWFGVGDDVHSWAYDPTRGYAWHRSPKFYGPDAGISDGAVIGVVVSASIRSFPSAVLPPASFGHSPPKLGLSPNRATPPSPRTRVWEKISGKMGFFLNGEFLGVAFDHMVVEEGFYPAISMLCGEGRECCVDVNCGEREFVYKECMRENKCFGASEPVGGAGGVRWAAIEKVDLADGPNSALSTDFPWTLSEGVSSSTGMDSGSGSDGEFELPMRMQQNES